MPNLYYSSLLAYSSLVVIGRLAFLFFWHWALRVCALGASSAVQLVTWTEETGRVLKETIMSVLIKA